MKTALITGANRGIGLEFARQLKHKDYQVIGTCRRTNEAKELQELADEVFCLDVTQDTDIAQLKKTLKHKSIDLLILNAGISGEQGVGIGNINRENFIHVLNVNCISAIKICDALLPNLQLSEDKQILVVSSSMGSIAENDSGRAYAYRSSKAALNCVMRSFGLDVKPLGIQVMLIHPGWVKTNMGGEKALIDVETSVAGMLKQAEHHLPNSHAQELRRFDGGLVSW